MEHGADEEHVYLISSRTLGRAVITVAYGLQNTIQLISFPFLKSRIHVNSSEDTAESHIGVESKYTWNFLVGLPM